MAARIFYLDELATRIATHLLAIGGFRSTVALALTCRALEVPALKTLWETEACSPKDLILRLLPDLWCSIYPDPEDEPHLRLLALERPLTAWELKRVERYTSWIRRFVVREWRFSEEIARLFVSMSARSAPVLRLHLRELNLLLHESNLSLFPKLLSPSLTTIVVTANSNELWGEQLYHKMNVTMRSAIMTLPSSLRCLHLQLGSGPQKRFTKEISAFILRCGESFQEFDTNLVLSTQAIVHLMNLPNLRTWVTEQGPPQVTDLINHGVPDGSASLFPSLEALELGGDAAFEWLSLFAALKEHTPPWTMAGNGLRMFAYRNSTASIGSTLLSTLLPLAHLTYVSIQMICWGRPCDSQFTDQDVESLAIALPELQTLELGNFPCGNGTCPTTVRSLLSLSIHCRELRSLSIHFSTENLGVDMLNLLDNTYSQGLHLKSKCSLETLVTGAISFKSADHELVLISIGMLTIFPALARFITRSPCWVQLEDTMETVGRSRESLATTTEDLVRRLNEVKGQAERGGPVRSIDEIARMICDPLSFSQDVGDNRQQNDQLVAPLDSSSGFPTVSWKLMWSCIAVAIVLGCWNVG